MIALVYVIAFLLGAASVVAIFYVLGQRKMDEIGDSFALSDPSCPWCKGALDVVHNEAYRDGARQRVWLRCDCGANVVVYGQKGDIPMASKGEANA